MIDIEKIKKNKSTEELLEFGIINIDKPSGPTSFNISDFVRKTLNTLKENDVEKTKKLNSKQRKQISLIRKTSHFGTLDPKVTGVLPIALNRACKLTGYFLGEDKEYIGIMRLHEEVKLDDIKKIINEKFLGKIKQTPPVKSRVKRQEREREIKRFEILEKKGKDFLFLSEVQGGTYIRKLCDDLGRDLGIGAHMLELRRVRAGIFCEDAKEYPSVNLYDFEKAVHEAKGGNDKLLRKIIIPGEIVSLLHPIVKIKKDSVKRILHGSPIYDSDLVKKTNLEKETRVCVFFSCQFIGMYKTSKDSEIFAMSEFVMQQIKNQQS